MAERNGGFRVVEFRYRSCKRQPDCPKEACPLQDVKKDLSKAIASGPINIQKAKDLYMTSGLILAQEAHLLESNGQGLVEAEREYCAFECRQGSMWNDDLKPCGAAALIEETGYISQNGTLLDKVQILQVIDK